MVNLDNLSLDYFIYSFKNGDVVSIFGKENNENNYYLLDYFTIDIRYIDIIDVYNQIKEIYCYNKTKENKLFYNRLFKENELKSKEYMQTKNIII